MFSLADDLLGGLVTVEQRGSLLESPVLRLDDEEVEEDELEGDPADVDDLRCK